MIFSLCYGKFSSKLPNETSLIAPYNWLPALQISRTIPVNDIGIRNIDLDFTLGVVVTAVMASCQVLDTPDFRKS